jgi:acyl-coenzyme A thioesterase PaaI-like protein
VIPQDKVVSDIERLPKRERLEQLLKAIEANPFMTDEELMRSFQVSIQTVRLDRLELGIPELRERMKHLAVQTYDQVRSLPMDEIIGEVIDLHLNQSGISMFEIRDEHVFSRTKIARGHHVFSQANSLAVAVINDPIALTASADIRFLRPVKLGEKCVSKAYVRSISKGKAKVEAVTYVGEEIVFKGNFVIFHSKKEQHAEGGSSHADSD